MGKKAFGVWGVEVLNEVRCETPARSELSDPDLHLPMPLYPFHMDEAPVRSLHTDLIEEFAGVHSHEAEGRDVVWTDGSALTLDGGKRTRAGAGVFYGARNPRNTALPVGGRRTANRAELTALCHVVENDSRALEVRADSQYVVQGVANRAQWRRNAWYSKPSLARRIPNADLWFRLDKRLRSEGRPEVVVKKVRGHAGPGHLADGTATSIDVWGNAARTGLRSMPPATATSCPLRVSTHGT